MCPRNFIIIYGKLLTVFSICLILLPFTNQDEAFNQLPDHCHAFSECKDQFLYDSQDNTHLRFRRDLSDNKSDEYAFWKLYSRFHGVQKKFYEELARRDKQVYWKRIFRGSNWKGPLHLQYFEILRRVNNWFNEYQNVTNSRLPFEIEDLETVHDKAKAVVDLRQRDLPKHPANTEEELRHRRVIVLWNQIVHTIQKVLDHQKALIQGIVLE